MRLNTIVKGLLVSLLVDPIAARHVHHRLKHAHHRRQASSLSASDAVNASNAAVMQDIANIEQSISAIPSDLQSFLYAVQAQLQAAESIIASLLGSSPSTSSVASPSGIPASSSSAKPTTTAYTTFLFTEPVPTSSGTHSSISKTYTKTYTYTGRRTVTRTVLETSTIYTTRTSASSSSSSETTSSSGPEYVFPVGNHTFSIPLAVGTSASSASTASNTTSVSSTSTFVPSLPSPNRYSYSAPSSATATATAIATATATASPFAVATFNARARDNVAVYYGQSPSTQASDLQTLCENSNINIVILAFVTSFFSPTGMPSVDFGPGCTGSTSQQQTTAPGLRDCTSIAPAISTCQSRGKKVLVSLGGYTGSSTLPTNSSATQLASNLWDLFGAGTGPLSSPFLRPFGANITLDGFDLDNESHDPSHYDTLASAFRTLFATDTSKPYYLSAAPQCPYPDASIPLAALAQTDFVFVQFYNNPQCDLSGDGFGASFGTWSADLAQLSNTTRVFVGAGAFSGAGSGYVPGDALGGRVALAQQGSVGNLGGVMLWDGSEGLRNVDGAGMNYLQYAKSALEV
ncbi:hypothetical protein MBLNU457_g0118t1 [Dothideomycetes sp. NU457]